MLLVRNEERKNSSHEETSLEGTIEDETTKRKKGKIAIEIKIRKKKRERANTEAI